MFSEILCLLLAFLWVLPIVAPRGEIIPVIPYGGVEVSILVPSLLWRLGDVNESIWYRLALELIIVDRSTVPIVGVLTEALALVPLLLIAGAM